MSTSECGVQGDSVHLTLSTPKPVLMKLSNAEAPQGQLVMPAGEREGSSSHPEHSPSCSLPSSPSTAGSQPKKGSVADPGFMGVAPGRLVMTWAPAGQQRS